MLPPILLSNVFAGHRDNGVITKASMNRTGPISLKDILSRYDIHNISGSFKFYEDKEIAIWYVFGVKPNFAMIHELTYYGVHLFIIFPDMYDGEDIDKFEMYTMFHSCIMNICKYAYQFKDVSFENSKYVSDLMEVDFDRDMEYFAACNVFRLTRECDPKIRKTIEVIEGKYMQFVKKNVEEIGKGRMFW